MQVRLRIARQRHGCAFHGLNVSSAVILSAKAKDASVRVNAHRLHETRL